METGCGLCLKRLIYKSTEKIFKKDEAQKRTFIFENKYFQSHGRFRITAKSNGLSLNSSGSQVGVLIMRLSHKPTRKQIHKEAKTSTILRHDTVQGTIIIRCYLQEL